jgi:hypothetical protein
MQAIGWLSHQSREASRWLEFRYIKSKECKPSDGFPFPFLYFFPILFTFSEAFNISKKKSELFYGLISSKGYRFIFFLIPIALKHNTLVKFVVFLLRKKPISS